MVLNIHLLTFVISLLTLADAFSVALYLNNAK